MKLFRLTPAGKLSSLVTVAGLERSRSFPRFRVAVSSDDDSCTPGECRGDLCVGSSSEAVLNRRWCGGRFSFIGASVARKKGGDRDGDRFFRLPIRWFIAAVAGCDDVGSDAIGFD